MGERLLLYEPDEAAWHLAAELLGHPDVAIAAIVLPDGDREPAETVPTFARLRRGLLARITRDALGAAADPTVTTVVDASSPPTFRERFPGVEARGVGILPVFAARLLWAPDADAPDGPARTAQRIRELGEIVAPLTDRGTLCDGLLALAIRVTGAEAGSLLWLDRASNELGVEASTHLDRELWPAIRIPVGSGIAGRVAAAGRPLRLHGAEPAADLGATQPRPDIAASLILPLHAGGKACGALCLHHGSNTNAFDKAARRLARRIAPEIARMIARTDSPSPETTERAEPWRVLAAQQLRLGAAEDLADVVRHAAEAAAEALGAAHAVLRLRDPASSRFAIRAYSGALEGAQRNALFQRDRRVAAQAVSERSAVVAEDGNAIAAPLVREGRVVGTVAVYDRATAAPPAARVFGDEDRERLTHLAAAIQQAMQAAVDRDRATRGHPLDPETDLAGAAAIHDTIHAEVVRSHRTGDPFAVVVCSLANYDALAACDDGARLPHLALRMAAALRAHVREFDAIARTAPSEFLAVLPHPGPHATDRILALTRAVADDLTKDDALNDPVRLELRFGYAVHPDDGRDRDSLLRHARQLQIEVV